MSERASSPSDPVSGPSVVVLDYGSGNVRSVVRALERAGASVTLTGDFDTALAADGLVVPGVGAYAACMAGLREIKGERIIGRRLSGGRPVLGICVGMQVLFAGGVEHGVETDGCDEWPGLVTRLEADVVPHMGWNTVEAPDGSRLFAGVEQHEGGMCDAEDGGECLRVRIVPHRCIGLGIDPLAECRRVTRQRERAHGPRFDDLMPEDQLACCAAPRPAGDDRQPVDELAAPHRDGGK